MKVGELIRELSYYSPDAVVEVGHEDERLYTHTVYADLVPEQAAYRHTKDYVVVILTLDKDI